MEDKALTKIAVQATLHCLTGCAIGEILGSVIGAGFHWTTMATEFLTVPLAFAFGYALTCRPLLSHGLSLKQAAKVALASDSLSILTMEIVDTLILVLIPGAISAGLGSVLFWASLATALFVAFLFAVPVNRYLISRGKGHAIVHKYHD